MKEPTAVDLSSAPDSAAEGPSGGVEVGVGGAAAGGAEEEAVSAAAEENAPALVEGEETQSAVQTGTTPSTSEEQGAESGAQGTSGDAEEVLKTAPSADPATANLGEESKLQSQKSEVQEVQWSSFGGQGGFGSFSDFLSGSLQAQDDHAGASPESNLFSFNAQSTSGAGSKAEGQLENDVSFFDLDPAGFERERRALHSPRVFPEPAAPVQAKPEEWAPHMQANESQKPVQDTELDQDQWQNAQSQNQQQDWLSIGSDHSQWNNSQPNALLQQPPGPTLSEEAWQELAEYPGWRYNTLTGEWRAKETPDTGLGLSWDSSAGQDVAQPSASGNQTGQWQDGTISTRVSGIDETLQLGQSAVPFYERTREEERAGQTDGTHNSVSEVGNTILSQHSLPAIQESNGEMGSGQSHSGWEDQYPGWYYDYHAQEWKQYSQPSQQPPVSSGYIPLEQQTSFESAPTAASFEASISLSNGFSQGYNPVGWSGVKEQQQVNTGGAYVQDTPGREDGFSRNSQVGTLHSAQTQFPEQWGRSQGQVNTSYSYDQSGQPPFNGATRPSDFIEGNRDATYRADQFYSQKQSQFVSENAFNPYATGQLPGYTSQPSYQMNSYGNLQFSQYTALTPPKSLEEAMRTPIGRAPHALVSFGFGGKLVLVKVKDSLSLESSDVHQAVGNGQSCGSGPVVVHSLSYLFAQAALCGTADAGYFGALSRSTLSGPLVGGSVSTKDLFKWLDDRAANSQSDRLHFGNSDSVSKLWGLLILSCKHYGKLRSQPGSAGLTSQDEDGAETALAKLLTSGGDQSSWTMGSFRSTVCLQAMPSEHQMQVTAAELKKLLVAGKRKEALKTAQQGQLWGPALVLSRQLGEKYYADTVAEMAHHQFLPGSPLRTLNLLLAGQPAEVFSGIATPAAPAQQPMQFPSETGNSAESGLGSMLEEWQENLSIIAANRTSGDDRVISHLGDCLWKVKGEVAAAHICYLVADASFEAFSSNARLCLVGADHWKNPRTYASPEAIQRTEVYEYSKVLGNPQYILLPFQAYKLVYASMLAEAGKTAEALRYCQAVLKTLKIASRTPEVETCRQAAMSLEERLKVSLGGSSVNLAPAKLVRGLLSALDRGISGIIGGPPLPTAQEEFQAGATVESAPLQDHLSSARFGTSPNRTQGPLGPSASAEKLKESGLSMPQRSVSEPDFSATMKEKAEQGKPTSRVGYLGRFGSVFSKAGGIVSLVSKTSKKEAKLGDKNTFRYDETLKRWVEEGAENLPEEAALAPPPISTKFMSKPEEASSDTQFVLGGGASTSGNKSGAFLGTPPVPPSNQFSARSRPQGVRSRYVDTFNKGGNSTSSSKPVISAFAPAVRAGGTMQQPMNFFVPAPSADLSNGSVSNSDNGTSLGGGDHLGYFPEPAARLQDHLDVNPSQSAAQNENGQGRMGTGVHMFPSSENNSAYNAKLMQGVSSSNKDAAFEGLESIGQTSTSPRNRNLGFSNGHHSRANSWSGYPSTFQTSIVETNSSSHENSSGNFSMYNGFSSQSTTVNATATVGSYFPSIPKVDIYNPENDTRMRETLTLPLPSVSTSMPSTTVGELRPVLAESATVGKQTDISVVGDDLQEVEL